MYTGSLQPTVFAHFKGQGSTDTWGETYLESYDGNNLLNRYYRRLHIPHSIKGKVNVSLHYVDIKEDNLSKMTYNV